jgi:cell division protein FtsB
MPMSFINPKLNKKRASKPRAFTLMFVPHSGDKTRRLRLPLWALQMLLIVMLTFVGGLSWLGKDYLRLRANTEELVRLRSENRSQAQRIEELAEEAIAVKERLIEVDELDKKVREMLGLPQPGAGRIGFKNKSKLVSGWTRAVGNTSRYS